MQSRLEVEMTKYSRIIPSVFLVCYGAPQNAFNKLSEKIQNEVIVIAASDWRPVFGVR